MSAVRTLNDFFYNNAQRLILVSERVHDVHEHVGNHTHMYIFPQIELYKCERMQKKYSHKRWLIMQIQRYSQYADEFSAETHMRIQVLAAVVVVAGTLAFGLS